MVKNTRKNLAYFENDDKNWRNVMAFFANLCMQDGAVGQAANDDETPRSSHSPARLPMLEDRLFNALDDKWAGALTLKQRLANVGIIVPLATVRACMRCLTARGFKRVESSSRPERWRRKPDASPMSSDPHTGPLPDAGSGLSSGHAIVANDNSFAAGEAGASSHAVCPTAHSTILSNRIGDDAVVHLGDCLEIMRSMPSGCIDLIVTSPPYNLGVSRGRKRGNKTNTNWKSPLLDHGYASYDDARDPADYDNWQKECLTEMWRLLSSNGAIFYVHKPRVQGKILQTPLRLNPGLPLRQIVTWDRRSGNNFNSYFFTPSTEWVLIFAKPDFKLNGLTPRERDVWPILPERGSSHPAPFPVALPLTAIRNTSAKVVFDPFTGSGSTGVAALRLGRKFVGLELDAGYVEMAKTRLAAELQARAAQPDSDA